MRQKKLSIAVGFAIAVVGTVLLTVSHAATPFVSQEPEGGTVKAPAAVIADTTASGSKAIKFTAAAVGSPSGVAMPVGDVSGWKQVYAEDFTKTAALGQVASVYGTNMAGYNDGTPTTNQNNGQWYPSKVLSAQNGVLDYYLHTENGKHLAATPVPYGWHGQKYGRYVVRFKADSLPGYKTAFLLWPESGNWGDGEIDFPEADLNEPVTAAVHYIGSNPGGFTKVTGTTNYQSWHTYAMEWYPGHVKVYVDDTLLRDFTADVPTVAHYWALQVETAAGEPATATAGHLQVDWVTVYDYVAK